MKKLFFPLFIACSAAAFSQITVQLAPIPSGAAQVIGTYAPQRLELSESRPPTLQILPPGVRRPLYGVLPLRVPDMVYHVVLDEPDEKTCSLFVDANGDGDMTNDPAVNWTEEESTTVEYLGWTVILLVSGTASQHVGIRLYRFDPENPANAAMKNSLMYYRDYAMEGRLLLDDDYYRVILSDDKVVGDFRDPSVRLLIDLNEDNVFSFPRESFDSTGPFNIDGTTYVASGMDPLGRSFTLVKSAVSVPETPPPPDSSVGTAARSFAAVDMDGRLVGFPSSFPGKIVLLSFWATWSESCANEMVELVDLYNKYHARGFEILGVSFDSPGMASSLRAWMKDKGMTWRQVYDGREWNAEVGLLYGVKDVPFAWLVDGDTGKIIASNALLRGHWLEMTVEQVLKDKGKL